MRILSINPEPITEIPFLNAGRGPRGFYEDRLPILTAVVDRLPGGMSAIIATADLQGRERFQDSPNGVPRLLGEALPSRIATEILPGLGLDMGAVGVFLAGDLYTVPALDRRGGSGDVRAVWEAFGDEFSWVIGVAGNHDTYGTDDPVGGHRGSPLIREVVERLRPSLIVRGHAHWKQPLVQLSGGVQVLNVDARVVVLHA